MRKTIVTTSLDAMASGGMYDHIGGGFARYSVDEKWLVPHFEKMLYDQALLIRVYLHAYLVFGEERWKQVVDETVEYVLRELRHPSGGFYSAEDADSPDEHGHGHEGLFHTWTIAEVRDVLGADADIALEWYEFTEGGNFEGRTIPDSVAAPRRAARPPEVESARQRLFDARAARRRPLLDDKVLTEWNGLMLASLAEAAASLDRARLARGCRRERPIPRRQPPWSRRPMASFMAGRRATPGAPRRTWPPTTPQSSTPSLDWRKRLVTGRGSITRAASPTRCSTTSGTSTTEACSPPPTTANNSSPARRT